MYRNHSPKLQLLHGFIALIPLISVLLFSSAVQAQGDADKPEKLFASDKTLDVRLTGPWRDIQRNEENQQPYPAQLEYRDARGNTVTLDITVQRRGITRQRVCDFPPIRLNFDKSQVKGTIFRGQKNLKMVTHCERADRYEQYYVLEMLAYRMYNLITDYSFRVRALKVTYVDSMTGSDDEGRFAFVIEDDSDVAKRHDLKKLNIPSLRVSQLQPDVTSEFSLFQYLIANVDWSALAGPDTDCCHNVKLIGPEPLRTGDMAYPIPYDFDSSGLVDAPYAVPPNGVPIRSVRQRLYRGYCADNDTLEAARNKFIAQESAIYALLENEERLYTTTRKKSLKYIGKFFDTLRDPKDFNKDVIQKCRK
jgi:hypothetical protein